MKKNKCVFCKKESENTFKNQHFCGDCISEIWRKKEQRVVMEAIDKFTQDMEQKIEKMWGDK